MEKSEKKAGVGSYLWFSFVLTFFIGLLAGVFGAVLGLLAYLLVMLIAGGDVAADFAAYFRPDGSLDGPTYFAVIAIILSVLVLVVLYFVARKEFECQYKKFAAKFKNADMGLALKYAILFPVTLKVIEFLVTMKDMSREDLIIDLVGSAVSFVVVFAAFKAAMCRLGKSKKA